MSKRTLVCGSLAYDTIMVFPDRFARHILPDQTHMLSVSFQIGEMRREWGGCAGNIAYNLKALGGEPVVMATLGADGAAYRERLEQPRHRRRRRATSLPQMFTAQAFIITDLDDNQITAFHPGAMNASHENRVGDVADIALGIVAPDGRDGMRVARRAVRAGGDSVRVRSGPGIAALLRAGADRDDRRGVVRRGQRLRGPAPGRAHGAVARRDRASASTR